MIKKLLLSLMIVLSVANAYESDLIRPKKGQGTIIDIGINDPTQHNTVIAKEWILVDSLFKEIDKENARVARDLSEEFDCLTDDLENQNCPEKQETCPKSYLYDKGESVKYTVSYPGGDVYTGTDEFGTKQYACPGDMAQTGTYQGTCHIITTGMDLPSAYLGGKSKKKKCTTMSSGDWKIYACDKNGGKWKIIGSPCGETTGYLPGKSQTSICSGIMNNTKSKWKGGTKQKRYYGFSFSGASKINTEYCEVRKTCEKTYNYFLYNCDALIAADKSQFPWYGPVINTGADCGGSCSGYNCNCNSVDGPWDNCQKPQWLCPFDTSKPCTKIIDGNTDGLEEGDGTYIYDNGSSEQYDTRLFQERSCVEGMVWNIDEQRCEDDALKKCLKEGYTLDIALNECYGPASCGKYEEYDTRTMKCISRISNVKKCKSGFHFDDNENRCIVDPKCKKGMLGANGKCQGTIERCYSGEYDVNGNCKFFVNDKHIFGEIQLLSNTGTFSNGDTPSYSYLTSSQDEVTIEPEQGEYESNNDSPTGYQMNFLTTAPENYDLGTIYPSGTAVRGDKITFNFWIKWDGTVSGSGGMPIAFSGYDLWIRNTQEGTIGMGFNTGQGDIVGIMDMSPFANQWVELTAVFTHLDPEQNRLYVNGIEIPRKHNIYDATDAVYKTFNSLAEVKAYQRSSGHNMRVTQDPRANIEGPIHFNGWEVSNNYGLNYSIAGLKVYSEAKTYEEIHSNADGSNLMKLHSKEQISSISTSYLKSKGFGEGNALIMNTFHMGSGCGLLKFDPAPDSYVILDSHGSEFESNFCSQNNVLIGSSDKENATITARWNNPPERIDYLCDDFCFISPRKQNIVTAAKIITKEVCPQNKNDVYWRYENSSCIADIVTEPFICEGSDWVYDPLEDVCAALMDKWHIAAGASAGTWYTSEDKRQMYQAKNGGVILRISDKIYDSEVTFKGDFIIMDGTSPLFDSIDTWATRGAIDHYKDDDFIGFVFGYNEENSKGYLLSINKSLIDPDAAGAGHPFSGRGTVSGASLRYGNPLTHPWGLGGTTELTVLETNLGTKTELQNDSRIFDGWHREEKIAIKVQYTTSFIKVWIRNKLIIERNLVAGEYKTGKIGFLNYSQGSVLYNGFQILTSDLCKDGLIFSEVLNKCYVPIATIYANTGGRTFADDISNGIYKTEAFCPVNGELVGNTCNYDLTCDIGAFNATSLYCEDPLSSELCELPKVQDISDIYKQVAFEGKINIKASGGLSYHFPDLRNKKSGLSISSTLLKLSDGSWYKFEPIGTNEDIGWRDAEIANSGLSIKTITASNYEIKSYPVGDCYNFDGNGDIKSSNECIGEIDIQLPEGLSLIEISDVQSITNESTSNNFFNEIFTINDRYTFYRKGFGRIASIKLSGSEPVCTTSPICPDGEVLQYRGSTPICISQEFLYYCKEGKELVPNTAICMNDGFCEDGFINYDGKCIRDYTYFKYFCPVGYEISEEGIDCEGSCGFDDCLCNTKIPPANNCKKPYNPTDTVEQKEVRTIREHLVTGSLLEEEYGNYKNYNCGENCKFNIVKIEGKGSNICFEKSNGDSDCLTVDGCSFKGSIVDLYNDAEVPKLKDLNLIDTHTLTLAAYKMPAIVQPQESINCPSAGMSYSTATRYCEGSANFYNWEKKGSSDGAWSVTAGGDKIFQGFNTTSAAFYVSKIIYPQNVVFKGRMTTGNDGDDDYVGLTFGYKDTSNYYRIQLSRDPSDPVGHGVTHTGNKLALIKVTSGSSTTLETAAHAGWRVNQPLNIKIAYIDKKILVFIDGTEWISYDSPVDLQGGRIGFFNLSQSTVTYDGFHISSSPSCQTGFTWDDSSRSCTKEAPMPDVSNNKIESTCKMNGHIGWHSREEGIVSIVSDGDRIKFWDPYIDKDLGFLEFVKDTNEKDNEDGFIPENHYLYNLLSDGFTSIDTIGGNLFFISGDLLSKQQCEFFAAKYKLNEFITVGNSDKLKQMSGNRYKKMGINPKCNEGVFSEEIKGCIGGINNPQLCVDGKFPASSAGLIYLIPYGINIGSGTITQPLQISSSNEYTVQIETSGTLGLSIDGEAIANINSTEPYARFKMKLKKGLHRIDITGSGSIAMTVSDDSETIFFDTKKWCKNDLAVTCPVSGFTNYHNICERATSTYCEYGTYDEGTKSCILEPKCVLLNNGVDNSSFADQDQSVRIKFKKNGNIKRICSPLVCKDNFCQLATCPDPSIGTSVELTAAESGQGLCLDQECDANKAFYEFCGIQGSCDTSREDVIVIGEYPNDKCYEKYCDTGAYDPTTGKCKVLECPSNTIEDINGYCKRK